ncbi:hypothetical protein NE865_03029 [Phthorimaea operculella]|nr:hypothetical protein NE865_03029 [Phthorimaea operculella]
MELSKRMKIDVINMSYGEHSHWANAGSKTIDSIDNRYSSLLFNYRLSIVLQSIVFYLTATLAATVSLSIGHSRLGSMETGTALVRACIKVMELSKRMKIDVINMSYGEHSHWANAG